MEKCAISEALTVVRGVEEAEEEAEEEEEEGGKEEREERFRRKLGAWRSDRETEGKREGLKRDIGASRGKG